MYVIKTNTLKNELHFMQQVKAYNNSFLRKFTQALDSV